MADRFFPNEMPAFVEEKEGAVAPSSLHNLLYLPYPKTTDQFLRAALHLKEKVVKETWVRCGRRAKDFTLYTGALGTAFLLFKAYQVTNNRSDLSLSSEIIRACDFASQGDPHVTFICGRAGVCALGALVAKHAGDEGLLNHYLSSFREMTFYRLVKYFNSRCAEASRYNMQRGTYEVVTRRFSEALRGGGNVQNVSLSDRNCSCGKWTIYKYLCTHVLAVCQEIGMDSMPLVDEVYSIGSYINAWGGEFNPLPHEDYWMETPFTCIPDRDRLRPKKKGKPKSTRIPNEMDEVQPRSRSR